MTKHPSRRRVRAAAVACGLVLAATLAACSAAPQSSPSSATGDERALPAAPGGTDLAPATKDGGAGVTAGKPPAALPPTLPQTAVQRSIIYNGSLAVQVTDVNGAADRAEALAAGAGGYVGGDARQLVAGHAEATVVLRVPAERFDATMTALAALGTPVDRQVTTQDVTSQVIDVSSRIKTQQASVDRVRALLAKATTIGDVESIESELTQRESDLESMEAQLAALSDLSALSTITLTLLEPDAPLPVADKPAGKGFLAGLKSGWKSFQSSLSTVLTWLGAVLPYAVAIGVPLWAILWLTRRRRLRHPVVTAQLATAGGPPLPQYGTPTRQPSAPNATEAQEPGQDAG